MDNSHNEPHQSADKTAGPRNYSLCRSSCSVCPYRNGLLKLLDHNIKIVPTLPETEN